MTIQEIRTVIRKIYGVSPRTRKRNIKSSIAKFTYYTLARKYTKQNLMSIGRCVGFDHATVLNGLMKLDGLLKSYPEYKPFYKESERIVLDNSSKDDTIFYEKYKAEFLDAEKLQSNKIIYEKPSIRQCEKDILNALSNLDDSDILNFNETRLKPYLKMLKSRKIQTVNTVDGAKRKFVLN